jgi:transposase
VYQLPSYSPDYNPIEHLWRNVKRDQTHNRYFPTFESLIQAVEDGLGHFQARPAAVKQLMGRYLEEQAACGQAA